jgi:serine/threonine protein kinase
MLLLATDRARILQVSVLGHLHGMNAVYMDVKPDNFMIGYGEKAQVVHLVDLDTVYPVGLACPKAGSLLFNSRQVLAGQGAATRIVRFSCIG